MAVRPNNKKWKEWKEKNPDTIHDSLPELTAAKRMHMPDFIQKCDDMGVKPTKRQAAKYNAERNRWSNDRSRVLN